MSTKQKHFKLFFLADKQAYNLISLMNAHYLPGEIVFIKIHCRANFFLDLIIFCLCIYVFSIMYICAPKA